MEIRPRSLRRVRVQVSSRIAIAPRGARVSKPTRLRRGSSPATTESPGDRRQTVLGVDVAETALAIAREKAHGRGIEVEFAAADAFHLERLGRRFETVLDCGLFHTFDGDERPGYVASLASVTEHDGTLYVLCCCFLLVFVGYVLRKHLVDLNSKTLSVAFTVVQPLKKNVPANGAGCRNMSVGIRCTSSNFTQNQFGTRHKVPSSLP